MGLDKTKSLANLKPSTNQLTIVLKTEHRNQERIKKKNQDIKNMMEGGLPKVKSTIYSAPKFVDKYLMSGANKYIGGTFRNTPLET